MVLLKRFEQGQRNLSQWRIIGTLMLAFIALRLTSSSTKLKLVEVRNTRNKNAFIQYGGIHMVALDLSKICFLP